MTKLLTVEGNPKTAKGEKLGFWTAILHLAPARLSGFEVCPKASNGCRAACLNTAGHGGLTKGPRLTYAQLAAGERTNPVQAARVWRTRWLFEDRQAFLKRLVREIELHVRKCEAAGFAPAIRLNGTSDIRWEAAAFGLDGQTLFDRFPNVQFYDYTKIANRRNLPSNYALTFSHADGNRADVERAIGAGLNVAVVFRSAEVRASYMASGFMGLPVIDGDETDLRFLDPVQSVVGLYAKGAAKRDVSGFVVD
jgi:hypothetical protein